MTVIIDFNRLAAFVADADNNAIEKELSTVKVLTDVKNALGQSLLFVAVAADRHRVLDILVKRGLRLSETDNHGRSLLHWATKFSAFNCLKYLLDPKFDNHVLLGDNSKVTPLHLAVQHKRAKVLKILLNALPENTELYKIIDTYGRTPLHYAAHSGSLEAVVELLNDDRIAVDQRDAFQQIPLMYAVSSNFSTDVVRVLSQKKPMSTTNTRNNLGQTAFHLAVLANNLEAIRIMLHESEGKSATVAVSFDHRCRTPLHYAAAMGRVEAAELLIANGARNDTLDNYGASAAHYAAQVCVKTLEAILNASGSGDEITDKKKRSCLMWAVLAENESVVVWMLSSKSLSIDRRAKDENLCSALHLAAQIGNLPIAKLLAQQGWSMTDRDVNNATPSHLAAGGGHTELIRYFQTALADKDEVDCANRTPLFYACAAGQASTVKILIVDLNFDVSKRDKNGQTPLHYAAFSGIPACVKVLLESPQCNVNAEDDFGRTAIHVACQRGKRDIVQLLIQAGADIDSTGVKQSESPLYIAQSNGHNSIVDLLLSYGAQQNPVDIRIFQS